MHSEVSDETWHCLLHLSLIVSTWRCGLLLKSALLCPVFLVRPWWGAEQLIPLCVPVFCIPFPDPDAGAEGWDGPFLPAAFSPTPPSLHNLLCVRLLPWQQGTCWACGVAFPVSHRRWHVVLAEHRQPTGSEWGRLNPDPGHEPGCGSAAPCHLCWPQSSWWIPALTPPVPTSPGRDSSARICFLGQPRLQVVTVVVAVQLRWFAGLVEKVLHYLMDQSSGLWGHSSEQTPWICALFLSRSVQVTGVNLELKDRGLSSSLC